MSTSVYTIIPFNIEGDVEVGRYISASCRVFGFWSRDPINLYAQRESYNGEAKWRLTMSHNTGGRDSKEVESDTEASKNFGLALIAAAEYGEKFMAENADKLEEAYQANIARMRREEEERKAAHQKAMDEDTPLGYPQAMAKMFELEEGKMVRLYRRASNYPVLVTCSKGFKTLFYVNGTRTAKKEVLDVLANASARTQVVEVGK